MDGWTRLKIVLSLIYWAVVGLLEWVYMQPDSAGDGMGVVFPVAALVLYVAAAAIWWAFAGFSRR